MCTEGAGQAFYLLVNSRGLRGWRRNPQGNGPNLPYVTLRVSKAMTERILADTALAGGLKYVILRYFNVAGADPSGR